MEEVIKTFYLSDGNGIFKGYTDILELYNELKSITMLFLPGQITIRFNLCVAFFNSVSIGHTQIGQGSYKETR